MQVLLEDYSRLAGVATDLVNTAPRVWRGVDKLADPGALARFLADHDLLPQVSGDTDPPTAVDLDEVHDLRSRLREVLEADTADELAGRAAALTAPASVALGLEQDKDGRWHWLASPRPDTTPADTLALAAGVGILGVLRALGFDRFRACGSPTCFGLFIDTSRPGRRRYCMPDLCGNRINVANHRARRHARQRVGPPGRDVVRDDDGWTSSR